MQATPYLFFNGDCRAALTFWAEVFRTPPPQIMTFGDTVPGADPEGVMHGALNLGSGWIYASDDLEETAVAMAGASLHVSVGSVEEAQRVFAALSEGGEVRMPLEETFWDPAFGTCTDRFGVRWMISGAAVAG